MHGITGTINRKTMKNISLLILFAAGLSIFMACGNKTSETTEEVIVPKAVVSTTSLKKGRIEEQITLNARTVFLKKNEVVAPISGYITEVNGKYGDKVEADRILFKIQTRENKALQKTEVGNNGTPAMGEIAVAATTSGVINQPITFGAGTYVTEGTSLCSLADNNDLLVRVNVPFEYHTLLHQGTPCILMLQDNSQSEGTVYLVRPFVDENSQTQEVLVKPKRTHTWPENMNLTVSFLKNSNDSTLLIPKAALLTNETQDEFWVMKIANDSVAVKVNVQTGIKNDSLLEIVNTSLTPEDIIILEGGYGLEDSSLVTVVK